jgi:hypothetical protein
MINSTSIQAPKTPHSKTLYEKKILKILLLLATPFIGNAFTPQMPDRLIIGQDTFRLNASPLESHPDIDSMHERLFGEGNTCEGFTACGRGYIATWQLIDNTLYLLSIHNCCDKGSSKAHLWFLFGKKYQNGRVKADWLSAQLISPRGKQLYNLYSSVGIGYEKDIVYEFEEGILKNTVVHDNTKSKISKYSPNTELFRQFIYSRIRWQHIPKTTKKLIVVLEITTDKQGNIGEAIVRKSAGDAFDREALRVVRLIPEWSVYYRMGKIMPMSWHLPVIFSEENKKRYCKP